MIGDLVRMITKVLTILRPDDDNTLLFFEFYDMKPYSSHYFIVVLPQLENNQNLQQKYVFIDHTTTQRLHDANKWHTSTKKMCGPLFCHTPAAASCNLLKIAIDTHAKFGMFQGNEQSRLGLFFSVANQSQVGNFFFFPVPPLLNGWYM